jgi:hypothetical protein
MTDNFAGVQRLRLFAARYGRPVGAVLAVAGIVLLSVAGAAMAAPTEEAAVERDPRTMTTTHAVNATVTETVAPYRAGQALENEPRYLLDAAPNATVTSTTALPDGGSAEARLVLSYAVVADETRLWATNRTLAAASGSDSIRLTHTLNYSAVRERAARLARNFGAGTTVNVAVETVVDYETGPHAGEYRATSAVAFPNSRSYAVAPTERSVTRTETATVTRVDQDRTIGQSGVSPARAGVGAAGVALLAGAGWFVWGRRQFDAAAERRRLHARRYDVYITSVEGPLDYGWPDEFVASLAALADYAIDTNNQILECQQTGVYLVRDDGRTLVYDPRVEGWDVAAMAPSAPGIPDAPEGESPETPDPAAPDPADDAGAFGFDPEVEPGPDGRDGPD